MDCELCHQHPKGHESEPHPFVVECSVYGEDCDAHGWHRNALTYATREDAARAGANLYERWMGLKEYRVVELAEVK